MPASFKINHCTEELEVMSIPQIIKSICQRQLDFSKLHYSLILLLKQDISVSLQVNEQL